MNKQNKQTNNQTSKQASKQTNKQASNQTNKRSEAKRSEAKQSKAKQSSLLTSVFEYVTCFIHLGYRSYWAFVRFSTPYVLTREEKAQSCCAPTPKIWKLIWKAQDNSWKLIDVDGCLALDEPCDVAAAGVAFGWFSPGRDIALKIVQTKWIRTNGQ